MTGRWPKRQETGEGLAAEVLSCAACGEPQATVRHALCACPGTLDMYTSLAQDCCVPQRRNEQALLQTLYAQEGSSEECWLRVEYVGKAIFLVCGDTDSEDADDPAAEEGMAEDPEVIGVDQIDALIEQARAYARSGKSKQ